MTNNINRGRSHQAEPAVASRHVGARIPLTPGQTVKFFPSTGVYPARLEALEDCTPSGASSYPRNGIRHAVPCELLLASYPRW